MDLSIKNILMATPINNNLELDNLKKKSTKESQNKGTLNPDSISILSKKIHSPIWVSVSDAAQLGGIQTKTIRRAIQSKTLEYKIVKDRYLIDLQTLIIYLYSNTKLKNKLLSKGIGQYVEKWKK
ncbi:MAG: hypothetical protein NT091_01835 [Candidatus Falkowbacteria bacterium]|nr:hypothetical protein [Candidatus Falkowbacteria bacterium]